MAAMLENAMSRLSRLFLRLRKRALRCYEIGMLALLVGGAVVATLPSAASSETAPGAAGTQCGNIQSSNVVMVR